MGLTFHLQWLRLKPKQKSDRKHVSSINQPTYYKDKLSLFYCWYDKSGERSRDNHSCLTSFNSLSRSFQTISFPKRCRMYTYTITATKTSRVEVFYMTRPV